MIATLVDIAREHVREGRWDEGLRTFEEAFSLLPSQGSAIQAADLFRWIGDLRQKRGEIDVALELCEASLAVAKASNLDFQIACALNTIGIIYQAQGNLDLAERTYMEAAAKAEEIEHFQLLAMIHQNLGTLANIHGDVALALVRYGAALDAAGRLDDDQTRAWILNNMGMANIDLGRWADAARCFDNAFEIADRLRDAFTVALLELNRADLHLKQGNFDQARVCCDRSFETYSRLESRPRLSEVHKFYGVLYRETGQPALSYIHFEKALAEALASDDLLLEGETHREWALLHQSEGRSREALASLNRAHQIFQALRARRDILDVDGRLNDLEGLYLAVTREWGESIESKDSYTAGHCDRVAEYACRLAVQFGIAGRDLAWFRMGAFLHDVGKIHVPLETLNKPGKLTAEEWETVKNHTVAGDEIVAELNFPWDVRPIVRSHHERWDGSGYPDGLAGDEIPFVARILCVADVFDALTTARSYRPALSRAEALEIMRRDRGKMFEPVLFDAFETLLEEVPTPSARAA